MAALLRETGASPLRPADPGGVGPYVPLGLLGSGGMGRVYLAGSADGDGPALVAVKVIRPEYAEDHRFRRRFEREASVHARLRTPRTPGLCGTGFQDELLWMATEYVPGLDLAEHVREAGAPAIAAVWRLVAELGQALGDLAAAGIVHRDLKPSNVLLSVRGAHVIDFGISKAADASALTGTGNRVGTPAYMSPEHLRTGRSDTASDVFSLAGTLVYAATGRAPFGDGTGVDVMHRVAFEEPDPELIGEIVAADATLGSLLSACLAKEPERRPTPQDLVDAAGEHAGATAWPEPLNGRVLARQRAYEALGPLSMERARRSRSTGDRPAPPSAERAVRTGPAVSGAPPEPLRPARARAWARKEPVLAAAAGLTLCAVAAAVFLLSRQDIAVSGISAGAGGTSAGRTVPGGVPVTPESVTEHGKAATSGSSGKEANGAADVTDIGDSAHPEVTGSPDGEAESDSDSGVGVGVGGRSGSSARGPEPGTNGRTPSSTPPADSTPESATPPWISECTHYSGQGLTRRGDSGKRVSQVQCMLTKRGYDVGGHGVDGEFGPGTESAVQSFQSARGLAADGVVGHATWSALRSTD